VKSVLTLVVAPVIVILLGAWLVGFPSFVKSHLFPGKNTHDLSPVTVAVMKENLACGGAWIVRKPLSALPKTPPSEDSSADWTPWVKASGASDAGYTYVTVTIQGRTGQVVYLTGIRFNVKHNPPIRGAMVETQCGGPLIGRYVEADLDTEPPRIIESSSNPEATVGMVPNTTKPLTFPYAISDTDALVLIIQGDAQKFDCVWTADVSWQSEGVSGIAHIDNNGVPFETSPSRYATRIVHGIT